FFLISQIFGKLASLINAPHLVGYLISGVLFGPYVLHIIPRQIVSEMELFTDIALAIIAFSIGASLKLDEVKKKKRVILGISLIQAAFCSIIVSLSLFASFYYFYPSESFNGILSISLIVGAISAASSPAALMSVIHEYKSQGHLTTLLLGITAFSDVITLILYAFALSIAEILVSEATFSFYSGLIEPILSIFFAIVLGVVFGLFIKAIIRYFPKEEVLLGLMLGAVFLIGGVSQKLDFS